MNKLFVSYEIALKLKELGFDEKCLGYFGLDNNLYLFDSEETISQINTGSKGLYITAPLYQQVFDWARNKYNVVATIDFDKVEFYDSKDEELEEPIVKYEFHINEIGFEYPKYISGFKHLTSGRGYKTYDEARLQCLILLIDSIEKL